MRKRGQGIPHPLRQTLGAPQSCNPLPHTPTHPGQATQPSGQGLFLKQDKICFSPGPQTLRNCLNYFSFL